MWRLAPLYLLADLEWCAGRAAEAAALERRARLFVPRMMWRTWVHPRGLVLLARARARLGDLAGARAALARFLAELGRDGSRGPPPRGGAGAPR